MFPTIGGVFRIGASRLDGLDTLAGDDEVLLENRLRATLFPALTNTDKRYEKKIADIDHLIAHKLRERDIFVTDDKEDILRRVRVLKDEFGITVMTPKDALELIERTTNVRLVVEDYKSDFEALTRLLEKHLANEPWIDQEMKTYGSLRVRLLRAFPKFWSRLANFRLEQSSQPAGSYALTDLLSLDRLQRDRDPFRKFYEGENAIDSIERFVHRYSAERDDQWGAYEDSPSTEELFRSEAERTRTMLEEFLGFLESQPV